MNPSREPTRKRRPWLITNEVAMIEEVVIENEEEWDIIRDDRGYISKVKIHRKRRIKKRK